MHVVRHQAPCPRFDAGGAAIFGQQVAIERVIAVVEEGSRAAIAPLGDVVRMTGNDNTGEAGHEAWCRQRRAVSIKCTVTVICHRNLCHRNPGGDGYDLSLSGSYESD